MINFLHVLSIIGAILSGLLIFILPTAQLYTAIGAMIGCILNILFYGELKKMKKDIEELKK